jgi:hypothetical protein
LEDYDTVIYAGPTSASFELYFQGKKLYYLATDDFIDIDSLMDNGLVKKIYTLSDIKDNNKKFTEKEKQYFLGCNNKTLNTVLKEIRK